MSLKRLILMGTPSFTVPTFEALRDAGHDIAAIYTQPPRAAHRGKKPTPSVVQSWAEAHGLPVRCPVSLRDPDVQAAFAALGADAAIVAAYGLILPQAVLDAPTLGCLNVHGSLLPRWRGAAPVQRAILAGDEMTGVCVMQMERGLDTGPVRLAVEAPIGRDDAGTLTDRLARLGADAMVRVIADPDAYPPLPQPAEGVTYADKIDKAEARLDFTLDAAQLDRAVRAMAPSPGAWTMLGDERLRVLAGEIVPDSSHEAQPGTVIDDRLTIACGAGSAYRPTLVQRAGRPAMDAAALLRGFPIGPGTRL